MWPGEDHTTHWHTHAHTCTHLHLMHTHAHTRTHPRIHVHTHTHVHMHAHACTHSCAHTVEGSMRTGRAGVGCAAGRAPRRPGWVPAAAAGFYPQTRPHDCILQTRRQGSAHSSGHRPQGSDPRASGAFCSCSSSSCMEAGLRRAWEEHSRGTQSELHARRSWLFDAGAKARVCFLRQLAINKAWKISEFEIIFKFLLQQPAS